VRALDTNVLVRFVTGDDSPQAERVRALFRSAEEGRERLFVPLPATLELIWVLTSSYETPKPAIVETLKRLLDLSYLRFEHDDRIQELLADAGQSPLGLSDLMVALSAGENGCTTTLTFDRRAARSPLFSAL